MVTLDTTRGSSKKKWALSKTARFIHSMNVWIHVTQVIYLLRLGRLHRIDSLDLDLIPLFSRSWLTLRRHPLNNRDSGGWLDTGRLRRGLRPRQGDSFRLGQKLGWIVRGYRRAAVLLPFRPGEYVTPAAVRHVTAEDAGNESSGWLTGRVARRLLLRRRRRRRRTATA